MTSLSSEGLTMEKSRVVTVTVMAGLFAAALRSGVVLAQTAGPNQGSQTVLDQINRSLSQLELQHQLEQQRDFEASQRTLRAEECRARAKGILRCEE